MWLPYVLRDVNFSWAIQSVDMLGLIFHYHIDIFNQFLRRKLLSVKPGPEIVYVLTQSVQSLVDIVKGAVDLSGVCSMNV